MKFTNIQRKEVCTEPKNNSSGAINYKEYKLNRNEYIKYYFISVVSFFLLGILFYRNLKIALFLCLLSLYCKKYYVNFLKNKRINKLIEGFRDVLYSISSSVAAGRQLPKATEDCVQMCSKVYGLNSDICVEMKKIADAYKTTHAQIDVLFTDFGNRSGLDEIIQFAQAISICKTMGGDMEKVCLKSSKIILDKIEFQSETKMLISQKKLDIILLTLMPILILIFLNLTNYSYISVLYETMQGRLVMTFCLALICLALSWGIKITDLKI